MKSYLIFTIIGVSFMCTGCTFKEATQKNNITGNLITTVFDDRNSFEDIEINEKIEEEVSKFGGSPNTQEKDANFWEHIINQIKNMRWK